MTVNKNLKLIPLSAVPSLLAERTGVQRCRGTIYSWAKKGCRTMSGGNVKLKTVLRLGRLYTTQEDVDNFIREVG